MRASALGLWLREHLDGMRVHVQADLCHLYLTTPVLPKWSNEPQTVYNNNLSETVEGIQDLRF